MQPRTKTSRSDAGPEPAAAAPVVLLVGQAPAALQVLAAQVRAALPTARLEMLASTTELVFRLAGKEVPILVIDSANMDETLPSLMSLPRVASAALRLAFVGGPAASPHAIGADALPRWLLAAARAPL